MPYRSFFSKEYRRSLIFGLVLLALALALQFYASSYSERVSSNFVQDIILDNVPVVNLNFLIVEGALAAIAGSIVLIVCKPRYILFILKASAIFIATRAIFIAATHTGIYPGQINPDMTGFFDRLYANLGLSGGFFFSGHTGYPFLMALIFWRERLWRWLYIAIAIVFGIAVLFAHVHYTIDVLAAPYITYGIFKMSQYFFPEDFKLIENPL
jgi:hypothetical protein